MATDRVAGAVAGEQDRRMSPRDFDYGIGDELDNAVQQVRRQIAAGIRRTAAQHAAASPDVRLAYEAAARLAEGGR